MKSIKRGSAPEFRIYAEAKASFSEREVERFATDAGMEASATNASLRTPHAAESGGAGGGTD